MDTNSEKYYSEETQATIDSYLLGTLCDDDLATFIQKMELDPALRAAVDEQKILLDGVEEFNLRKSMKSFHKEIKEKRPPKPIYGWFAVAATIAIIVGVISWSLFFNPNTPDKIFAKNFKPDPGLPTTMGASSNYNFYEGMVSYKRENYKEALAQWQPLYKENGENDTLNYFIGVAYLANGDSKKAEKYLSKTFELQTSVFFEEAQYYLALSQVKEGRVSDAKKTLENTTSSASAVLLQQLKELE